MLPGTTTWHVNWLVTESILQMRVFWSDPGWADEQNGLVGKIIADRGPHACVDQSSARQREY